MIFPPKKTESQFKTFGRFTLGTFVLFGLGIIPVVGFLIGMAISLISFGTLIMFYKEAGECLRKEKLV
jgi:ABC-type nickel/cobalt efflux system permease component RcnA